MSSRQTGSRYDEGSSMGLSGGVGRNPNTAPLLAQLFGQDKITGGLTQDAQGNYGYTPEQGSSGFLGGWSRGQARQNNNLYGSPMMLQQLMGKQQQQLSAQEALQERTKAELTNRLQKEIMRYAGENALSANNKISIDDLHKLAPLLVDRVMTQTQNQIDAERDPAVKKSYQDATIGANQAKGYENRAMTRQVAGPESVSTMEGQPTLYGGVPGGSTTTIQGTGPVDPKTGQPMMQTPITNTQPGIPGRASIPIPQGMMPQPGSGQQPMSLPSPATGNIQSGMPPQQNNQLLNYINGQQGIATGAIDPNALFQPGPSPAGNVGQPVNRNPGSSGSQFGAQGGQAQDAAMQLLNALLINPQFGFGQ